MDKKLTLSLNSSVIDKAKGYAKSHGTSLSKMIENYLSTIVDDRIEKENVFTPTVNRLIGVIEMPVDVDIDDFKSDYTDFLSEKYK